ncbi:MULTISPECIES: tryptophan transporter [unclassified Adlercreutzia]|uniref:tryptophan transporter n=1 Tax=unclassified Adlercreutzia TaxID=2636013 RepID=UPI001F14E70B|nr:MULTISPECIES: tryptophan transporter [unclassified Adlercreutzia]
MTDVNATAQKRVVAQQEKSGLAVQDLILVAVLIAAGAVLKLTVSSFLSFGGMKPNFMIAMYCLAIILVRPKVYQSVIIGLLVGLVSQIPMLNATPLVNIASEVLGALVCGVLVSALSKVAADNKACQNAVFPAVITFVSTVVSGYTFALIVGVAVAHLDPIAVFGVYAVMVFGTAVMNAVVAVILTPVLRAVLKR